jgi:diguanylate cyclase (GGDEF)-like protein
MAPPAAPLPSPEQTDALFWRRHARLGTGLCALVVLQTSLYALLADGLPHRGALLGINVGGAVMTVMAALLAPVAIRRGLAHSFFYVWSLSAAALVLAAVAVDGGDESPITAALFLPLLFAALAYRSSRVLGVGLVEMVGYLVIAAADGTPSRSRTLVVASTLGLASFMAARSARHREAQRDALDSLARRLRDLAARDSLTGCLNRRGFESALDAELARTARTGRPIAILLIDVDHLKAINDDRGHEAGDASLVAVARALTYAARRTDVVARVGGDEFAILAPETDDRAGLSLAVRIHEEVARSASPPATVSVGVASANHAGEAAEIMRAADTALYAAKRAGRNTTRVRRLANRVAASTGDLPRPRMTADGSSAVAAPPPAS